jgi:hypothetical protein
MAVDETAVSNERLPLGFGISHDGYGQGKSEVEAD